MSLCPLRWESLFQVLSPFVASLPTVRAGPTLISGTWKKSPRSSRESIAGRTTLFDYMKGIPCLRTLKFIQVVTLPQIT